MWTRASQLQVAGGRAATASYNSINFVSWLQKNAVDSPLVNGIVYIPHSGYLGDCGSYHGWVVGVYINNPSSVEAWRRQRLAAEIGATACASDGTNMFVVTGNTFNTGGNWMGGEAIIRCRQDDMERSAHRLRVRPIG